MSLKEGHSDFKVHKDVFWALFNVNHKLFARLNKLCKTGLPTQRLIPDKQVLNGGKNKMSADNANALFSILLCFPRESSHCASQSEDNSRKYYYLSQLSLSHFWLDYLKHSGIPSDTDFLDQCKLMNIFLSIMQSKKQEPAEERYHLDIVGTKLKPYVGNNSACCFCCQYDIKFVKV